ncbi:Lrp/AsnC family transcriptional regulator [Aestuariispira ectoiniformans]|uniref:Lrp/AsnC family transcriptional regulator n=1 Tax=Aestuariispira ectoiniformans TaxID=2775080 RepID=UPI00223AA439|nr:Lrp/AsnC family transcriptional regulator [Aestuariispira ectoiniformans]
MTGISFNKSDRKILEVLQREGRLSNVELADRIGMSPSPCLRRVKRLEEEGVIEGYSARVNRKKIGLGVMAACQVKLKNHDEQEVQAFVDAVVAMPEVTGFFSMTGRSDFLLLVHAPDLESYGRFATHRLLRLHNVQDVESGLVLEELKNTRALPLGHLAVE